MRERILNLIPRPVRRLPGLRRFYWQEWELDQARREAERLHRLLSPEDSAWEEK